MAKDISHAVLMQTLQYNKETGEFRWQPGVPNYARYKDEVGYLNAKGRRYINIHRQNYAAHRLAWFYVTQEWPDGMVFPKNGNYSDLRFENLKIVSPQDVASARRQRANPSSGTTGVSWEKRRAKWVAYLTVDYKRRHVGYFDTKEEAIGAHARAAKARDAFSGVNPTEMAALREKGRKDARYTALWRRVNRHYAGAVAWKTMREFAKDIGTELHDRQTLVPLDDNKPIGPGNWKWQLSLYYQFDKTTPEGRRAYQRLLSQRNPLGQRAREFQKKFGITLDDYYRMHDAQNGACAICKKPETYVRNGAVRWLSVDHCHSSGAIRGLLCNNCNNGVGRFRDDPKTLRKAADYLEQHAMKSANGVASNPLNKEREAHHGNHSS